MIRFSCNACGRSIKAPLESAGRSSKCPGCGERVTIPAAVEAPPAPFDPLEAIGAPIVAPPPTPTKISIAALAEESRPRCPYCREEIQADARKCKHCGEFLDGGQRISSPDTRRGSGDVQTIEATAKLWKLGQVIGVVIFFSGCIAIGVLHPQQRPSSSSPFTVGETVASFTSLFGIMVFLGSRVLAWWHHG